MSVESRRPAPRLYIITDRHAAQGQTVVEALDGTLARARAELPEGALAAGVAVQLRAKELPRAAFRALAREVRALTREYGCRLFVNSHIDIALAVAADGVHLPEDGPDIAEVRARAGHALAVGVSTHTPEAAGRAARAGAELVVLSPIWATSKDGPRGMPLGPGALGRACALMEDRADRLLALGGVISPERAEQAVAAGARGVAGIRVFVAAAKREGLLARMWRASDASWPASGRRPRLHSRDELG